MKSSVFAHKLSWIILILISGCGTATKISLKDLSVLYQSEGQFIQPQSRVLHLNDTVSALLVRVPYSGLMYRKDPFTGLYSCSYRIGYRLSTGYDDSGALESVNLVSGDSVHYGKSGYGVHTFELKARFPGRYLLEIGLTDLNRDASNQSYSWVNKTEHFGRQEYMLTDQTGEIVFSDYVPAGQAFRLISPDRSDFKLQVNCYLREFPVARPPYLEDREPVFDYRPDSSFTINFSGGSSEVFIVREMGFYHFLRDTSRRAGYTLFCFSDGYPDVTTPEQLAGPLRYITTRKEYDSVMSSGNLKAGVDNFWLSTARSPERALALLQKFYSQVEESNTWFSSYTEGWKTDRGLIFTVLGRPDYVFRDNDSEEWVYGEPGYRNSLRFTFVFVSNPFTDNDFMLLRSPTFKDPWFITVQSWRR